MIFGALILAVGMLANASEVHKVPTMNLDGDEMVRVAVPRFYNQSDSARFPVVYLLNGHGGDHDSWNNIIDLDSMASKYGYILVCPDGRNSWYFDSPVNDKMKMESFIVDDLVDWVDTNYRTMKGRDHRAIMGLSMGGHGAMWVGIRHPMVFGTVGSTSGGLDFRRWPNSWNIQDVLGPYEENPARWANHTVVSLLPLIASGRQNIFFDCGNEDFFYDVNSNFHNLLNRYEIPHGFVTLKGGHTSDYWRESLPLHLEVYQGFLN